MASKKNNEEITEQMKMEIAEEEVVETADTQPEEEPVDPTTEVEETEHKIPRCDCEGCESMRDYYGDDCEWHHPECECEYCQEENARIKAAQEQHYKEIEEAYAKKKARRKRFWGIILDGAMVVVAVAACVTMIWQAKVNSDLYNQNQHYEQVLDERNEQYWELAESYRTLRNAYLELYRQSEAALNKIAELEAANETLQGKLDALKELFAQMGEILGE